MRVMHHPESDSFYIAPEPDSIECAPVRACDVPRDTKITVGTGYSTVHADMDFETYSEAGFEFIEGAGRSTLGAWQKVDGAPSSSQSNPLSIVGAPCYSEHPSTEIVYLAYDLKDGFGPRLWMPSMPPPQELFDFIAGGGLIEAHNSGFEYLMWLNICHARMGWPALPLEQLRCSMSKCRSFSLMGGLGDAGKILKVTSPKMVEGMRLIKKFSGPRSPTLTDPRKRITVFDDPVDGQLFGEYCLGDIAAESEVSACVQDLDPDELELWLLDQRINTRGCAIDMESVENCRTIIKRAAELGDAEVVELTGGALQSFNQDQAMRKLLEGWGAKLPNMQAKTIEEHYAGWDELHPHAPHKAKRLLEIRATLASASVKKLHAMHLKTSSDGRLREMFSFYGADRTGRFSGRGAQPQNLKNSGPDLRQCGDANCGKHYGLAHNACPWCRASADWSTVVGWNVAAVDDVLQVANVAACHDSIKYVFGDPVELVGSCMRGMFISADDHEFICSDYSAIEAVVLACLAGEKWRVDVFKTHGKIYEMSAAKITGVPFETMMQCAGYVDLTVDNWWESPQTGEHHPHRKKIGKVAELASGYGGGLGAWKQFGAGGFMTDPEIETAKKAWRAESPAIVKFWYGLEDAAVNAVKFPGQCFNYNGISYGMKDDILYCQLLSGRKLKYHQARLVPDVTPWGKSVTKLCYYGRNEGAWALLHTYGGKLAENVTQAIARDILTHAMVNLDRAGYPIVLHVHDEIVAEVRTGTGDIAEFERIMEILPPWCAHWPIRAAGGWRGKRYRK